MRTLSQPFGPICEGIATGYEGEYGANAIFIPEVSYVRQGSRVHFFQGSRDLSESVDESTTVVEDFNELDLETVLDERTGQTRQVVKNGVWMVEGPYQRSDQKNSNGRTYARKIWERVLDPKGRAISDVNERGMIGHLEHPKDGRMDGKEGGLVTTSLKLRPDGVVWGVSELLDTPNGLILQEYTRKRVRWGVSSRGNGSVDDTGKVNETDYELVTFDAVIRPSTPGAYPKPMNSGKEGKPSEAVTTPASLSEDSAECVQAVTALQETEVEALDEASRAKFIGDLLQNLSRVNSLERSHDLGTEKARELQDWLISTLEAVQRVSESDAGRRVDELLATVDTETAVDEDAFRAIIVELRQQVEDLSEEATGLRSTLETTKAKLENAEVRLEVLEEEQRKSEARVAEMESELEAARDKLSIAEGVISDLTAVDVEDARKAAVEEAITQVRGLEKFRDVLEAAPTADRVLELAEQLLPTVVADGRDARVASAPTRPVSGCALPARGVLVESDFKGGSKPPTNPSRGARIAGGAVRQMRTVPK
jgi:hypothetical protein